MHSAVGHADHAGLDPAESLTFTTAVVAAKKKPPQSRRTAGATRDQVPWSYFSPKDQLTSASPGVSGGVAASVGREDAV